MVIKRKYLNLTISNAGMKIQSKKGQLLNKKTHYIGRIAELVIIEFFTF